MLARRTKPAKRRLRIAKEISQVATPINRPVSDLKVTYLVFPGTAETPFGPPDLEKLQAKCEELVKEIGGAGVPLHRWENIIPPLPHADADTDSGRGPNTVGHHAARGVPSSTFAFPLLTPTPTR